MSGSKKKKQCPYNEWVYCSDESCDCCGWCPGGRTKKKERKQPVKKQDSDGAEEENRRKMQKNNTSGYSGVYWNKRRRKWTAAIGEKGKTRHLGCFEKLEDAINARKEAEERMKRKKEE